MGVSLLVAGLAISTVSTGVSLYEAANQPSPPKAPTTQDNSKQQAQASQAAALAQAQALTKRKGMASTILTSPLGVSSPPPTQKATLGA